MTTSGSHGTRTPGLRAGRAAAHRAGTGPVERAGLWPVRIAWFLVAVVVGPIVGPALQHLARTGALAAEAGLWFLWFLGLIGTLVPATWSLTGIRVLAPLVVVLGVGCGIADGFDTAVAAAAGYGAVVTMVAYSPVTGDRMINGSAYGSERRMALRPPGFALVGPLQLAWLATAGGLVAGPWLLVAGHLSTGLVALVVGLPLAAAGFRVLHQMARRWIVFVPAGFVLHDQVLLVESVLMRRATVAALGPATAPLPDDATDLTGGAWGLALEASLSEPARFGLRVGREVVDTTSGRLVFTPTLPGAVLAEARVRAVPIGARH